MLKYTLFWTPTPAPQCAALPFTKDAKNSEGNVA